jgi:hypothetical protein
MQARNQALAGGILGLATLRSELPIGRPAAGVPESIWTMDARAGPITDAHDKGAREVDAMELGTHTQLATNRSYSRNHPAATSRVAILRFRAGALQG